MKAKEGSVNMGNDLVELTTFESSPPQDIVFSTFEAIMHLPSSAGRRDAAYWARQVMARSRRGIGLSVILCWSSTCGFFPDADFQLRINTFEL